MKLNYYLIKEIEVNKYSINNSSSSNTVLDCFQTNSNIVINNALAIILVHKKINRELFNKFYIKQKMYFDDVTEKVFTKANPGVGKIIGKFEYEKELKTVQIIIKELGGIIEVVPRITGKSLDVLYYNGAFKGVIQIEFKHIKGHDSSILRSYKKAKQQLDIGGYLLIRINCDDVYAEGVLYHMYHYSLRYNVDNSIQIIKDKVINVFEKKK